MQINKNITEYIKSKQHRLQVIKCSFWLITPKRHLQGFLKKHFKNLVHEYKANKITWHDGIFLCYDMRYFCPFSMANILLFLMLF